MAISYIIIKNNTLTDIFLDDLGISIDATSVIDLLELYNKEEIANSTDILIPISNGNFTVNDGTQDLSIADGIKHVTIQTEWEDLEEVPPHSILSHTDVDPNTLPGQNYLFRYKEGLLAWRATEPRTVTGQNPPDSTAAIWFSTSDYDLFYWDPIVQEWISIATNYYEFGRSGNVDGAYLGIGGWSTGGYYYIHHPGVITAIHISALSGTSTKGFEIRVNGVAQYSCNLVDYIFADHGLVVNLVEGDYLQLWCSSVGGPVRDVVCQLVNHGKQW